MPLEGEGISATTTHRRRVTLTAVCRFDIDSIVAESPHTTSALSTNNPDGKIANFYPRLGSILAVTIITATLFHEVLIHQSRPAADFRLHLPRDDLPLVLLNAVVADGFGDGDEDFFAVCFNSEREGLLYLLLKDWFVVPCVNCFMASLSWKMRENCQALNKVQLMRE